jgi:hypothetical protein
VITVRQVRVEKINYLRTGGSNPELSTKEIN